MLAMDVSDVYYDKFLMNGKNESQLSQFKAGDKVRLRISNGGASTYFWLTYAGGKITVVANDGNDVEPVEVDRLIIAVSETYDIVLTVPEKNKSFAFQATSEDRINRALMYQEDFLNEKGKFEKLSVELKEANEHLESQLYIPVYSVFSRL